MSLVKAGDMERDVLYSGKLQLSIFYGVFLKEVAWCLNLSSESRFLKVKFDLEPTLLPARF